MLSSADPTILDETIDVLDDPKRTIEEVLDAMKYDTAYEDLLQYLSISGIFNLTQGDFAEWADIKSLMSSFAQINPFVIDSLIPHQNPALGRILSQLLKDHHSPSIHVT